MSTTYNWNSASVVVTGAGGFIGSHLVERLVLLGAKTKALVRYNSAGSWGWLDESPVKDSVEVALGDVRDRETLRRAIRGSDVVFHLAALISIPYSYDAPNSYVQTNVQGTLNVMQEALMAEVKSVIHTSTSEVYGTARYVPIDEEHPLQGQSPYSASKIAADKMAQAFHRSFGLPVVTLRPFNTYGPRQSARAIIPTIVTQAMTDGVVHLGNLEPTRDLNYVADTVDGFVSAAEKAAAVGETINIGTGAEVSIKDLVDSICRLLGKKIQIETETRRKRRETSEVFRLCGDNTKARDLLGWQPQHNLEQGLLKTIEWIGANLERYKIGTYTI